MKGKIVDSEMDMTPVATYIMATNNADNKRRRLGSTDNNTLHISDLPDVIFPDIAKYLTNTSRAYFATAMKHHNMATMQLATAAII